MNFHPNLLMQAAQSGHRFEQRTPRYDPIVAHRPSGPQQISQDRITFTPPPSPMTPAPMQNHPNWQMSQEHLRCAADDLFKLQTQVSSILENKNLRY